MTDLEEARELLGIAERETRSAGAVLDEEDFADEVFGFLVQQATEKCLKAWLCVLGQLYPLTHNIETLIEQVATTDEAVLEFEDLTDWTAFGVRIRYSMSALASLPLSRPDALERVQALYDHVKRIVDSAEPGPDSPAGPDASTPPPH